ncbi:MAG: hypothetical protein KA310_03550 [Pseudomonadales bacterium]|nr:hypothetical protein [Pseudomonadales bacterium]
MTTACCRTCNGALFICRYCNTGWPDNKSTWRRRRTSGHKCPPVTTRQRLEWGQPKDVSRSAGRDRLPCPAHSPSVRHCDGCGSLEVQVSDYCWGREYDPQRERAWEQLRLDLCAGCYQRAEMGLDWLMHGVIVGEGDPSYEYIRRLESALVAQAFEAGRTSKPAVLALSIMRAKHALQDAQRLISEEVPTEDYRYAPTLERIRTSIADLERENSGPAPYRPTPGLG